MGAAVSSTVSSVLTDGRLPTGRAPICSKVSVHYDILYIVAVKYVVGVVVFFVARNPGMYCLLSRTLSFAVVQF